MNKNVHYFCEYFLELGLSEWMSTFLNMLILLLILCIIFFISDYITRKILVQAFSRLAERTTTNFDDLLVSHKAPRNIAHLVPLYITIQLFPTVFYDYPHFESAIIVLLIVYAILLTLWILRSVLRALESYFKT